MSAFAPAAPPALCLIIGLTALVGCVRFHDRPLAPDDRALAFERRSLDAPEVLGFIRQHRDGEVRNPGDPWDLTDLTLAAFYYHPDLALARARVDVADAGEITAGERPNPTVSWSPGYDTTTPTGLISPWILGFGLDVPVETAGKRAHRRAQARHVSEAARYRLAAALWHVRGGVRGSLLGLYAARQTLVLTRRHAEAQAALVSLLDRQLAAGAVSAVELGPERTALLRARLAEADADRQAEEAEGRLATTVGVPIEAIHGAAIAFGDLGDLPEDPVPAELRYRAVTNRADVLAALADYAAAQSALQLEVARQYPDLHLGPGYQLDQRDNKWSLGVSLTLPILNQNQGPIAEAEARRAEVAAAFDVVQAGAIAEVDRALAAYRSAREQVATARTLLAGTRQQRRVVGARHAAGEVDGTALAAADAEVAVAELGELSGLLAAQQALAALEDAVQWPVLRSSGTGGPTAAGEAPR